MSEEPAVLYTEEQIKSRVGELGQQISQAFAGQELCVLGLMKDSLVFMSDLIRRIGLDLTMHLLRVSTQREVTATRVMTEIVYATTAAPLEGRHVLLVDDIVDTGITLSYVLGHIHEHNPASLRVCALIDKPHARKIDVHPDWCAFSLPDSLGADRFLVGYGLGFRDRFRGLPYLGTIPLASRPA